MQPSYPLKILKCKYCGQGLGKMTIMKSNRERIYRKKRRSITYREMHSESMSYICKCTQSIARDISRTDQIFTRER